MQYKQIFPNKWNYRSVGLLLFLILLPNILGMLNISTALGFKIHFFQIAVFIASLLYGPVGGMLSGGIGSIYPAMLINNPYIVVGNMILGFFTGLFAGYGVNSVVSVMLAYAIQLPWLVVSDIYLAHMPMQAVKGVVIALFFSNMIWAFAADYAAKPIKRIAG